MPGIFGSADSAPDVDLAARLRAMGGRMRHHSSYQEELHAEEIAVGFGRLRLEFQKPDLHNDWTTQSLAVALVDGEIYDRLEQGSALRAAGHELRGESAGELLAVGYAAQGRTFFRGLHGKFAAAIWDRRRQQLILVNDRFGMRPLYYSHVAGRLLFASEIKGLLADPDVSRQANLRGIAQFFTFGQLLAEDTLIDGICLLPAASCLTYDLRHDQLTVESYWKLATEPPSRSGTDTGAMLDRLDQAFGAAVGRCTKSASSLGLSLSGGMDSRTILGAIDDDQPLTTVSVGMPGSADHRSAAEMARLSNRPHHQCLLGQNFLERFEEHLQHMVRLTDGHYLSQCIVMPTLPVYRELGIQVLLRGHAGELMHMRKAYSYSLDGQAMLLSDGAGLEDWLFRHLQGYLLEGTEGRLFAAPYRQHIEGLARESLRNCLRVSEGMQPVIHRIWHLFLTQRLRRETAMSMVKFGSLMETRLPYLDNELVDVLFATPPAIKLDQTIQADILRRRRPSFLRVLNVNTGARVDAGRFGRFVGKVRHKVFAKLGVSGYQPYERLGLWLRRELRPLVQKLLLGPECLGRGIFDPDTVKKVVDDHCRGKNHTFLILALMTFEMGHREFLDGRGSDLAVTPAHAKT